MPNRPTSLQKWLRSGAPARVAALPIGHPAPPRSAFEHFPKRTGDVTVRPSCPRESCGILAAVAEIASPSQRQAARLYAAAVLVALRTKSARPAPASRAPQAAEAACAPCGRSQSQTAPPQPAPPGADAARSRPMVLTPQAAGQWYLCFQQPARRGTSVTDSTARDAILRPATSHQPPQGHVVSGPAQLCGQPLHPPIADSPLPPQCQEAWSRHCSPVCRARPGKEDS